MKTLYVIEWRWRHRNDTDARRKWQPVLGGHLSPVTTSKAARLAIEMRGDHDNCEYRATPFRRATK